MDQIAEAIHLSETALSDGMDTVHHLWMEATQRMSHFGGPIRDRDGIGQAAKAVEDSLAAFSNNVKVGSPHGLSKAFRLRDVLICQQVYLRAVEAYIAAGGKSRGSALYSDPSGEKAHESLPDHLAFSINDGILSDKVQIITRSGNACSISWRDVRPIPNDDSFFENTWRAFRENGNTV